MSLSAMDYELIRQLVARYNFALDLGDIATVGRCYVEDGVFEIAGFPSDHPIGGRHVGAANLLKYYSRHFSAYQGLVRHFNAGNAVIEGDGDEVTMKSYMIALNVGFEPIASILATAIYFDRLRKVDGEWLFVERRWVPDPQPEHSGNTLNQALLAADAKVSG